MSEFFSGHGVGELLHMPPMIYHHRNNNNDIMELGMVFTIEPIFLLNKSNKII